MQFSPSLEEVKKIAAEGKYDIVPISCEILSDAFTPIELMRIFKNVSTHCYMLESVSPDETWGRYTFMCLQADLKEIVLCGFFLPCFGLS